MSQQMMYLALTYDHRILDGREAVTFLVKVCTAHVELGSGDRSQCHRSRIISKTRAACSWARRFDGDVSSG